MYILSALSTLFGRYVRYIGLRYIYIYYPTMTKTIRSQWANQYLFSEILMNDHHTKQLSSRCNTYSENLTAQYLSDITTFPIINLKMRSVLDNDINLPLHYGCLSQVVPLKLIDLKKWYSSSSFEEMRLHGSPLMAITLWDWSLVRRSRGTVDVA